MFQFVAHCPLFCCWALLNGAWPKEFQQIFLELCLRRTENIALCFNCFYVFMNQIWFEWLSAVSIIFYKSTPLRLEIQFQKSTLDKTKSNFHQHKKYLDRFLFVFQALKHFVLSRLFSRKHKTGFLLQDFQFDRLGKKQPRHNVLAFLLLSFLADRTCRTSLLDFLRKHYSVPWSRNSHLLKIL